MSDCVSIFRLMKDHKAAERAVFGVACPVCIERLPKANAKILLPGQLCRAHKPHYRDPRPTEISDEDYNAAMRETGWQRS